MLWHPTVEYPVHRGRPHQSITIPEQVYEASAPQWLMKDWGQAEPARPAHLNRCRAQSQQVGGSLSSADRRDFIDGNECAEIVCAKREQGTVACAAPTHFNDGLDQMIGQISSQPRRDRLVKKQPHQRRSHFSRPEERLWPHPERRMENPRGIRPSKNCPQDSQRDFALAHVCR